jgi:DNA (cytosine-5)-methyltransferase 1
MRYGSLFTGYGGFDVAAEWMEWDVRFHCEKNTFCKQILKYYWPNATTHDDITTTDFTIYRGQIDILTGGFPCQPFSIVGERKGTADPRHLWPEMLRAIREINPEWVVGENVRGIFNWSGGLVFEQVCADLEAIGYEVVPVILPACGLNAEHRRERVWFVAHSNDNAGRGAKGNGNEEKEHVFSKPERPSSIRASSNSNSDLLQRRIRPDGSAKTISYFGSPLRSNTWKNFPSEPPVCSGNDGNADRLDGITFPKWRNESIKAAGNAIVPQIAFEIFKAIKAIELLTNETK